MILIDSKKYLSSHAKLSPFSFILNFDGHKMGEIIFKSICAIAFLGVVAASPAVGESKTSFIKVYQPRDSASPFWDPGFCDDWQDMDSFPQPNSCNEYLICWGGELWEQTCPPGMLFDPWDAVCAPASDVTCLDDSHSNDQLPNCPAGFFGRQPHPRMCNSYIRCSNGNRTVQQCPSFQLFDALQGRCRLRNLARCIKHIV